MLNEGEYPAKDWNENFNELEREIKRLKERAGDDERMQLDAIEHKLVLARQKLEQNSREESNLFMKARTALESIVDELKKFYNTPSSSHKKDDRDEDRL